MKRLICFSVWAFCLSAAVVPVCAQSSAGAQKKNLRQQDPLIKIEDSLQKQFEKLSAKPFHFKFD